MCVNTKEMPQTMWHKNSTQVCSHHVFNIATPKIIIMQFIKRSYNLYQDASLPLEIRKQKIYVTPQQCIPSLATPESLFLLICNFREKMIRNYAKYFDTSKVEVSIKDFFFLIQNLVRSSQGYLVDSFRLHIILV